MTFRFYITDPYDGALRGTNDEELAREYSLNADFFVADTEEGLWLTPTGDETIEEIERLEEPDEE